MLPDPLGLLSKTVPSTAIASANVEVWHMFEAQQATLPTKRGVYARFIPEEKAEVGKRAALPTRAWRGRDCPGSARVLPKSGLGTSGQGSKSIYVRMGVANRILSAKIISAKCL